MPPNREPRPGGYRTGLEKYVIGNNSTDDNAEIDARTLACDAHQYPGDLRFRRDEPLAELDCDTECHRRQSRHRATPRRNHAAAEEFLVALRKQNVQLARVTRRLRDFHQIGESISVEPTLELARRYDAFDTFEGLLELPIGLTINDILVLVGKSGPIATLPGKPQINRDGRQKTDVNGKAQYASILKWCDRHLSSRFSETVVELVHAAHPGAFANGGGS
jgi:hypothetical protein